MQERYKVSDLFFDDTGITLKITDISTSKQFMVALHDERLNYLLSEIIPQDVAMIEHLRALDGEPCPGESN